jgi:hypothetical protein
MHTHTSSCNSDCKTSDSSSRVLVISLRKAQLFIGKPYLNKKHLSYLFDIDDPDSVVLLDPEAEEINSDDQGNFECDVSKHYTIVTEADIEAEDTPVFVDQVYFAHILDVEERRKEFIKKYWTPKHQWLYEEAPSVLPEQIEECLKKISSDLYKLEHCFHEQFRSNFLEEVLEIEKSGLPLQQPNTMNRYGIVFSDFGLTHLFDSIYKQMDPLVQKYFPKVDFPITSHHAFLVQYKPNQQKDLGLHVDDASFTINLCLENTNTDEGELYFKEFDSNQAIRVKNIPGDAILHYGKQMHGAYPVNLGRRYNLIIWYRGSSFLNQ